MHSTKMFTSTYLIVEISVPDYKHYYAFHKKILQKVKLFKYLIEEISVPYYKHFMHSTKKCLQIPDTHLSYITLFF